MIRLNGLAQIANVLLDLATNEVSLRKAWRKLNGSLQERDGLLKLASIPPRIGQIKQRARIARLAFPRTLKTWHRFVQLSYLLQSQTEIIPDRPDSGLNFERAAE